MISMLVQVPDNKHTHSACPAKHCKCARSCCNVPCVHQGSQCCCSRSAAYCRWCLECKNRAELHVTMCSNSAMCSVSTEEYVHLQITALTQVKTNKYMFSETTKLQRSEQFYRHAVRHDSSKTIPNTFNMDYLIGRYINTMHMCNK